MKGNLRITFSFGKKVAEIEMKSSVWQVHVDGVDRQTDIVTSFQYNIMLI